VRSAEPLTDEQIASCRTAWELLGGPAFAPLDVSRAQPPFSLTCYNETTRTVFLGANVYAQPNAIDANSRMSMLACLAHELSHAQRHRRGYCRPSELPDMLLDEAEPSLNAAFNPVLSPREREDLVEDARDRLNQWIVRS